MYKLLLLILLNLVSVCTFSQVQLTDFVTSQNDVPSAPEGYVNFNGILVFTAATANEGLELWKSDGTSEGTRLVKDIYPGSTSSIKIRKPVIFNNSIYFFADNGSTGTQLWKSDGTESGTMMVTDFLSGTMSRLTVVGNQLFFLINTLPNNWEIWKSNGTAAGTVPIKKNITSWNQPDGFISIGSLFYVKIQPPDRNTVALWRSDGTEAGTFPIIDNLYGNGAGDFDWSGGTGNLTQYIEYNNQLYFVARSASLFGSSNSVGIIKTNGTVSGTVPVKEVYSGESLEYADVIEWKGKLYFSFYEADSKHLLIWETNGTESGTKKVYERTGNSFFIPSNMSATDTALLFAAPSPSGGSSLITLNPNSGQTQELKKISNAVQQPVFFTKRHYVTTITRGGDSFLINAVLKDSANYTTIRSIYLSDGTASGTIEKQNSLHLSAGVEPRAFYLNSTFYFTGSEIPTGGELWRSDGTVEGTSLLKNMNTAKSSGGNAMLFSLNNKLVFNPNDITIGTELWQSDGTKQSTTLLKDINPGKNGSSPFANRSYAHIGNQLLFSAINVEHGGELWKTDGMSEGTSLVKDLTPGSFSSFPKLFTQADSIIYFIANAENRENFLWKSDGTSEGTIKLLGFGISPYAIPTRVSDIIIAKDNIFILIAETSLWKYDESGTGLLKIKEFSKIRNFLTINNIVYFTILIPYNGQYELWKSDGTEAGTVLVKDQLGSDFSPPTLLTTLNNQILFATSNPISGRELWLSDGTEAGTLLLKDIAPGTKNGIQDSPGFVKKENIVYFQADDQEHGSELWQTDGTTAGTLLVKDILPGNQGSYPNNLAVVDNLLYFAAYTLEQGMELWKSNGTEAGTILAADIQLGAVNSNPAGMLGIGSNLYFIADTEQSGKQLWNLNTKQSQQITFSTIPVKTYKDAPFELVASASSGLQVTFSIVSGPATLSGNMLTITGAGQITVKASQAGNNNYHTLSVEQAFIVSKASQEITFPTIADRTLDETPIELSAISSSGLQVSYTVVSGQASVLNNILTIHEPGQIKVQAVQSGNENYTSATPVERSFTISGVVGLEDELSEKVNVFPNPASDYITIIIPQALHNSSVQIVDLRGQVLNSHLVNGQDNMLISIQQLPKGLYFLQIVDSQFIISRKFSIY